MRQSMEEFLPDQSSSMVRRLVSLSEFVRDQVVLVVVVHRGFVSEGLADVVCCWMLLGCVKVTLVVVSRSRQAWSVMVRCLM